MTTNQITLKHREGDVIDCGGVPLEFLRAIVEHGALNKGWAFKEIVERDPFADAPAVPARHIADEPAKAPRTRKSAGERKPRAEKPADEAVIAAVLAVMRAAGGPVKMADLSANVPAEGGETAIKRAVAVLVADGRVTVNGKARGTTYSLPAVAA